MPSSVTGGTSHLSRSYCFKPSADSAKHYSIATFHSWVQRTGNGVTPLLPQNSKAFLHPRPDSGTSL